MPELSGPLVDKIGEQLMEALDALGEGQLSITSVIHTHEETGRKIITFFVVPTPEKADEVERWVTASIKQVLGEDGWREQKEGE